MSKTPSIHADGWWDYMPPGHRIDIQIDPEGRTKIYRSDGSPVPTRSARLSTHGPSVRPAVQPNVEVRPTVVVEREVPVEPLIVNTAAPRRIKRSHAGAWILTLVVGVTGAALAVAHMNDPKSLGEHLDAAIAEVKHLANKDETPSTAHADEPLTVPVQETAPITTAQANIPDPGLSSEAPLPAIAPQAGRSVIHPEPDVAVAKPQPVQRVQPTPRQLATLEPSTTMVMPETQPLPVVTPPPAPLTPVTPVTPPPVTPPPVVEPPPAVTPPIVQPPVQPPMEVAPPVVQPPASSPPQ